jgi:hypothetical protein
LPTLAQLKELEDLRVQLTLPGADPLIAAATVDDAEALPDDEESDSTGTQDADSVQDAEGATPRPQGLVASGAQDDA